MTSSLSALREPRVRPAGLPGKSLWFHRPLPPGVGRSRPTQAYGVSLSRNQATQSATRTHDVITGANAATPWQHYAFASGCRLWGNAGGNIRGPLDHLGRVAATLGEVLLDRLDRVDDLLLGHRLDTTAVLNL